MTAMTGEKTSEAAGAPTTSNSRLAGGHGRALTLTHSSLYYHSNSASHAPPSSVKLILPALTEATSPLLASDQILAVSAARPRHAGRVSRSGRRGGHCGRARAAARDRRRARPRGDSGLHHQRLPRLPHRRPLPGEGRVRGARRPARDVAARRGGARTPTRCSSGRASRRFRSFLTEFRAGRPQRRVSLDRWAARSTACRRFAAT